MLLQHKQTSRKRAYSNWWKEDNEACVEAPETFNLYEYHRENIQVANIHMHAFPEMLLFQLIFDKFKP